METAFEDRQLERAGDPLMSSLALFPMMMHNAKLLQFFRDGESIDGCIKLIPSIPLIFRDMTSIPDKSVHNIHLYRIPHRCLL